MDWLQFISSMFGSLVSLAWPGLILGVIIYFRNDFRKLLPLLQVKYKGVEITVKDRLKEAEKDAAALPPQQVLPQAQPTPEEEDRFEKLAKISPSAAIIEESRAVEELILRLAATLPDLPSKKLSLLSATRLLRQENVIDSGLSALLDDLRSIRNAAAHTYRAEEPTYEDAVRYRELAQKAIVRLLQIELLR